MTVNERMFAMLLQAWWGFFDEKCVTSQEVVDLANDEASMRSRYEGALCDGEWEHEKRLIFYQWIALRTALGYFAVTKITGGDLDSILDEVKNEGVDNLVVERDGSCVQPVKWRIIKQENDIEG